MSEQISRYFSYQERESPEAILSITSGVRKQIQRFFDLNPSFIEIREVRSLLERCDAVLVLLEHEIWLNCDDGK